MIPHIKDNNGYRKVLDKAQLTTGVIVITSSRVQDIDNDDMKRTCHSTNTRINYQIDLIMIDDAH